MQAIQKIYIGILVGGITLLHSSCLKKYDNPSNGVPNEKTFLYAVRDVYHGSEVTLSPDKLDGASYIMGTVISDKSGANMEPGTFAIQETLATGNLVSDLTRGIIIKMASGNVASNTGDSVLVNVNDAKLDRINGRLVLSIAEDSKITKLADNRVPLVRPVTLAMMNTSMDQYESTLVSVHADVSDYGAGVTFSGERKLDDHTGASFYLRTRSEAAFAGTAVPIDAQFNGIAGYYNEKGNDTAGAKRIISLRNGTDVKFISGALYAGFPESFESPDFTLKPSYNSNNIIDLSTGNWTLAQAILANTVIRDKYNLPGKQCIRMQQNLTTSAYVQMNFDLTKGASKVTVFCGKYYTDPSSTFRLEYSVNGGTTWVTAGSNVLDMPEKGFKQASFLVNITGNVRFRINKLGLGTSSSTVFNGRLCIEDIAVYQN